VVVQSTVIGTAVTVPSIWAPLLAAVVGALATWALQQLSKGLWREIATLERRVAELEALRCPYGQAERDLCAARPAPDSPPRWAGDGQGIEL
jgi:hypothetical protein